MSQMIKISGLKSRVTVAFLGIATLLFISGMVAFYELNTLSDDTDVILKANDQNMELASRMLKAAQSQNASFIQIVAFDERGLDSTCLKSLDALEASVNRAKRGAANSAVLDSMLVSVIKMRTITKELLSTPKVDDSAIAMPTIDSISQNIYKDIYRRYQPLYDHVIIAIDTYMTSAQNSLAPRTEMLHNNAYRAVTPMFISLVVMIVVVLMLFYFMMLYCVNPVVAMNKALRDYLAFKVPFAIKGEWRDEVQELKERIEALISLSKKSSSK